MTESLRWWLVNPERWHAHPSTLVWGMAAGCVVLVGAAIVFWVKGKYWP